MIMTDFSIALLDPYCSVFLCEFFCNNTYNKNRYMHTLSANTWLRVSPAEFFFSDIFSQFNYIQMSISLICTLICYLESYRKTNLTWYLEAGNIYLLMFLFYCSIEFTTAAFRFGHSLVRQSFSHSSFGSLDISDMFNAFATTTQVGKSKLDCWLTLLLAILSIGLL